MNLKEKQLEYYKKTPVLETERLILRPITPDDAESVFVWCSDKRVNKFMPYNLYKSIDEAFEWITEIIPQDEVDYNWGIVLKENNLLIGSCSIGKNELELDAWGFGYNIRYDYWNKGITTEATMKMIEYAHKVHGIKTFVSNHAVDNPASGRVMEKCGLKFDHYGEYKTFDSKQTFKAKFYKLFLE